VRRGAHRTCPHIRYSYLPDNLFSRKERNGCKHYSLSRNTALYINPKTAVNASNAKNIVVMDFHPPSFVNILLEDEWSMMRS
jgi:hypothetical protein